MSKKEPERSEQLAAGEKIYRALLESNPQAAAQIIALAQNPDRFQVFLSVLQQALSPDQAAFNYQLGSALNEIKQYQTALESYDRAIALRPDFAEAFNDRGITLRQLKQFDEAVASYERAISIKPDFYAALYNLGNTQRELGRYDLALKSYARALEVKPDFTEALYNQGMTLDELGRYEEALACYDRMLALAPPFADLMYYRGNTLHNLRRYDAALKSYDAAITLAPNFAEAIFNRGNTLRRLKRYEEALQCYDEAIKIRPDYAQAYSFRANALYSLKRYDESIASYNRAIELKPDFVEALCCRGMILTSLHRYEQAREDYKKALTIEPNNAEAITVNAELLLLHGNLLEGWELNEWRWKRDDKASPQRNFSQPLWLGEEDFKGTILLHHEQGLGDTLHMLRYVPMVASPGRKIILEVPRPVMPLAATLTGVSQVIQEGKPLPPFDAQCPLMSLPLAFNTDLNSIPAPIPYLTIPPEKKESWAKRLGAKKKLRIGLAWSGNKTHPHNHLRSVELQYFLPFLEADAEFHSVQREYVDTDYELLKKTTQIKDYSGDLNDFSETGALMESLDLLIAVDTSVAHLAGAIGRPVWILVRYAPDWRWLLDREDTPWYPTARIFRQSNMDVWDDVLARVKSELLRFVRGEISSAPPKYK